MQPIFEEIDFQQTPLGDISLRRRSEPRLDNVIIYEVKLNEEFLMSSLFTEAEIQLSKIALIKLQTSYYTNEKLDIVVGGLGLGYSAAAVLENPNVNTLGVIDVMQPVIDWHQNKLVPLGESLCNDSRCIFIHADFYQLAAKSDSGFYQDNPSRLAHAVLLDIDHSPSHLLNESNNTFYTQVGLNQLASKILPHGVFGLWSNEPPDKHFTDLLNTVFSTTETHIITFPNPYTDEESENTVYISTNY